MHSAGGKLTYLTAVLLSAVLLTGCGDGGAKPGAKNGGKGAGDGEKAGVKRVIFLNNTDSPFWDACRSGLTEGEKQFKLGDSNLAVAWISNNGTAQGQIEKLRQFGTQSDIAAIAISVIQADNAAIMAEMKKLQEKGIKIITVDGDVNKKDFRDARTYYIGTDNIVGGRALGTCAKALLEGKKVAEGGYVQFAGFTDNDNARSRMDGVKQAMGEAYKELDRMPDQTDRSKARENVRNAITNHKDLVALMGIWSYNAPAIAEVAVQKGVREKMVVATFDAEEGAIEQMGNGNIDAMVVQDPFAMGFQTAKLLQAMVKDDQATLKEMFPNAGKEDGDIFTTGLRVVVTDEKSPVKKELFDPKVVEYMTLSQFKDWLKKYNLKSS